MKVAIIGGDNNGLFSDCLFTSKGHTVTFYERDKIMQATSRATSKLLHVDFLNDLLQINAKK